MSTAKEAAAWMWTRFQEHGELDQEEAVYEIEDRFGAKLVYMNESGNMAIDRRVLSEFRKLSGESVVWSRSERRWRRREPYDDPASRQAD